MSSTLLHTIINNKYLKIAVLLIAVFFVVSDRLKYFGDQSKDIYAYQKAIQDLTTGVNPYIWTIESYSNEDDPTNHGFAYFPSIIYLYTPLYSLANTLGVPVRYLWKIPVLIADIGVGVFLYLKLRRENVFIIALSQFVWFFNPYAYFRGGYTYFDPIPILLMMLSLHFLNKKNSLSGILYALSVSFKTFPYLIFPVFILKLLPSALAEIKEGQKFYKTELSKFLLSGAFIGLLISLPFLTSFENFRTYIEGTLLVHGKRFVQGRPFLYYISYFYKIELFRIISFKTYTMLASFAGWVVLTILNWRKIITNKYTMALIPFLGFYLFTPVLNRTYLIWFIPILTLSIHNTLKNRFKYMFYVVMTVFYTFYSWYLIQWEDGFHIWHP